MAPIVDYFDSIFSRYFNEFLQYDYIKSLHLPLWLYIVSGIFVFVIILWTLLVVHGLKHFIRRLLINSQSSKVKSGTAEYDTTTNTSNVHTAGADGSKLIWAHISPRKSIQQISSKHVNINWIKKTIVILNFTNCWSNYSVCGILSST